VKKNGLTQRKIESWGMPPEHAAACVACMEEGLETYAEADDPTPPVRWMDAPPVQWLQETRVPIAATTQHGTRGDDADERQGPASIFLLAAPLAGCRPATARTRRTKADWASDVAPILATRDADGVDGTRVGDNLNPHTKGACSEAFEPDLARAYWTRIKCCDTPQHGSWLHVAACERSCLTSQGMRGRRIGERTELPTAIGAWSDKTNAKQRGVDWPFRSENARVKLKRLYPKIKT